MFSEKWKVITAAVFMAGDGSLGSVGWDVILDQEWQTLPHPQSQTMCK